MKRVLTGKLWRLALAAIACAIIAGNARPEAAAANEILAAQERLRQYLKSGDAAGVVSMYAPDARLMSPGQTIEGEAAIRRQAEGAVAVIGDVRLEDVEVFLGADMAVERGRATFLNKQGAPVYVSSYMTLWKKSPGGQWRIFRDLGSPIRQSGGEQAQSTAFGIKRAPAGVAVILAMKGSHDQHMEALVRLASCLEKAGIQPSGPAFGLYYNSPGAVPDADLRWEIGLPTAAWPTAIAFPCEARELPAVDVAFTVAPKSQPRPWDALGRWVDAEGYIGVGPAMEIWDGDRVELRLPISKTSR